jgi:hypothetical protein
MEGLPEVSVTGVGSGEFAGAVADGFAGCAVGIAVEVGEATAEVSTGVEVRQAVRRTTASRQRRRIFFVIKPISSLERSNDLS